MIKETCFLLIIFCFSSNLFGQAAKEVIDDVPASLAATITVEDLKTHLNTLASDEYEGRETGTVGNEKAGIYIANHFEQLGLPPIGNDESYYQNVMFTWTMWKDISISIKKADKEEKFRHLREFLSFPTRNGEMPALKTDEIVFLGYGIDDSKYSDYRGKDLKGKVIMVYKGEPFDKKGKSRITGTTTPSKWTTSWEEKLKTAHEKGVKAVLFIENNLQKEISENRRFLVGPKLTLGEQDQPETQYANSCYISTNIAQAIIGKNLKKVKKARKKIRKRGKSKSVTLPVNFELVQTKNVRTLAGNNVLGYIEGNDPKLKEELVIITAHYDHLGKRGDDIFNGADDNGSGTSSVLEVAEAFAKAQQQGLGPRRSVLCMLVTGEEKGLLGSQFYAENPIFPIENTIANVNVDMVGRVDEKYADNPNYVYVIGSDRLSTELHDINENVNKTYTNLVLDYTYNADDDPNRYYYRSDHYNFAEKGIPAIFYFNGTHKDYHRTTDTVEKINFEKMAIIAKLVFHTAWQLANQDKRIEVNVTGRN
ncbi:MAG: M28 family peptidase [Bacteroidota bacterium]